MWSHERQAKILESISRDGKVQARALADQFDVSRETIRRDLLELEGRGGLLRVHGGALRTSDDVHPEPTFADRLELHTNIKHAIGRKACELIAPSSTVFIDAGTTTLAFARSVTRISGIRIITNSIEIAMLAGPVRGCETLLLGGKPDQEVPATYGELTLSEIDRFLADFAVIAPVALHITRGATSYELHEAEVARKMMRRAESCIMLCHSEKLGKESRVAICRADEIDHLVTDGGERSDLKLPRGTVHFAKT
jgi:DeoR/GlpR family transcriptional regulator of sugar metabolism